MMKESFTLSQYIEGKTWITIANETREELAGKMATEEPVYGPKRKLKHKIKEIEKKDTFDMKNTLLNIHARLLNKV